MDRNPFPRLRRLYQIGYAFLADQWLFAHHLVAAMIDALAVVVVVRNDDEVGVMRMRRDDRLAIDLGARHLRAAGVLDQGIDHEIAASRGSSFLFRGGTSHVCSLRLKGAVNGGMTERY